MEVLAEQAIERFRPPAGRPLFHWPLEFPEVFVDELGEPRENGGFDAVIGNPPYIRVQEIGREMADYCRARFTCASGSFDAYLHLLERGIGLLAPHGRLGFIVPNKLFKLDLAGRLRELLSQRELVDEVIDFGASQLFAGATNYTCILVLDAAGRKGWPIDGSPVRGSMSSKDFRRPSQYPQSALPPASSAAIVGPCQQKKRHCSVWPREGPNSSNGHTPNLPGLHHECRRRLRPRGSRLARGSPARVVPCI